jgi:hypothetical protein
MKPLLLSRGCSGFNPFCWVLVFTARPIAHVVPSIKMSCKKKTEKGKKRRAGSNLIFYLRSVRRKI